MPPFDVSSSKREGNVLENLQCNPIAKVNFYDDKPSYINNQKRLFQKFGSNVTSNKGSKSSSRYENEPLKKNVTIDAVHR
jgi:hypothetical protein